MPWRAQVKTSWTNLKSLYDKQIADSVIALDGKDQVIAGKDLTIKLLKEQLANATTGKYLFAGGGFLAGLGAGTALGYSLHK